jgi:hypothetical protein
MATRPVLCVVTSGLVVNEMRVGGLVVDGFLGMHDIALIVRVLHTHLSVVHLPVDWKVKNVERIVRDL